MSDTTTPTIADAKALAMKYRSSCGVIILSFSAVGDNLHLATASYGHTRALCDALGRVSNQILEKIQNGEITP